MCLYGNMNNQMYLPSMNQCSAAVPAHFCMRLSAVHILPKLLHTSRFFHLEAITLVPDAYNQYLT